MNLILIDKNMLAFAKDRTKKRLQEVERTWNMKPEHLRTKRFEFFKPENVLCGCCGEIAFHKFYGYPELTLIDSYQHDLRINKNNKSIEVKSFFVKRTPYENYHVSVSVKNNPVQECDYYAFMFVLNDYSRAWFAGFMPSAMFLEDATFHKAGTKQPNTKFIYPVDDLSMTADHLMKDINFLKGKVNHDNTSV